MDIRQVRVAFPGDAVKAAAETASGGKRESEYDNMFRTQEKCHVIPRPDDISSNAKNFVQSLKDLI